MSNEQVMQYKIAKKFIFIAILYKKSRGFLLNPRLFLFYLTTLMLRYFCPYQSNRDN